MEIKIIGVVGAGVMGSGVAQVSAVAGYRVLVQDVNEMSLERSQSGIAASLNKFVSKGKITQVQADTALSNIEHTTDLNQLCERSDLIIEAVFENLSVKHDLFKKFAEAARPDTILASNTLALPITEIASVTDRGENIVGIHFMNPVPLMKGVEVIRGQLTSDETMQAATDYIKKLGKEPIPAVDYAGFIVSRLLDVLTNEAVKMVQEGNEPKAIDQAMELCAGHPMGPCRLLDLVGAESAMHGMETMARDFGDAYKPHPLLKKRVMAGLLGKKSGRGFYDYKA